MSSSIVESTNVNDNSDDIAFTRISDENGFEDNDNQSSSKTFQSTSDVLDKMMDMVNNLLGMLRTHQTHLKVIKKEIKSFEKNYDKMLAKQNRRKRPKDGPVGFQKPVALTNEFATFLYEEMLPILQKRYEIAENDTNKEKKKKRKVNRENEELYSIVEQFQSKLPKGQYHWMPRSDTSKLLSKYVVYHNLQNPKQKKYIVLNNSNPKSKRLKQILRGVQDEDTITFINIQSYIQHNYVKNVDIPKEIEEYYIKRYRSDREINTPSSSSLPSSSSRWK